MQLWWCACFFFFFSSRRRHTRCSRDWSSDVCSSDLGPPDRDGFTVLEKPVWRRRLLGPEEEAQLGLLAFLQVGLVESGYTEGGLELIFDVPVCGDVVESAE